MSDDDRIIDELRAALDEGAEQLPTTPPPFDQVTATDRRYDNSSGRWRLLMIAAAAIILAAGGAVIAIVANDDGNTPTAATQPPANEEARTAGSDSAAAIEVITTIATVLQDPGGEPELCTNVADSLPPQCDGTPITNWDWSAVESEEAQGTRWGSYVLVGHYNSTLTEFTVTEPARAPTPEDYEAISEPDDEPDFSTPCPTPEGGWRPPPSSTVLLDGEPVYPNPMIDGDKLRAVPGYGGSWSDLSTGVVNVRIVGDQQARAAAADAIAEFYSDPVCIVESTRTWSEVVQIQQEINNEYLDRENSPITGTGLTDLGPTHPSAVISIDLRAPNSNLVRELHERYGDAITIEPTFGIPEVDELPVLPSVPNSGRDGDATTDTRRESVDPSENVEMEATVIEFPDGEPQLCTAVTTSPPGCEGATITNWSWSNVEHDEDGGTRWGRYFVVGSSDEAAAEFTLSHPAESVTDQPPSVSMMVLREEDHSTPCPEPETGWRPPPSTVWEAGSEPVYQPPADEDGYYPPEGVIDTPGFGGLWWDRSSGVLNVRIVGSEQDREVAADSLADLTGAPVCVVPSQYTEAELREVHGELIDEYGGSIANDGGPVADTGIANGGAGEPTGYVPIMLRTPDRELIAELSERYGSAIKIVPRFGDSWTDFARRSSVPPDTGP